MKVQFLQVEVSELSILKEETLNFVNHQNFNLENVSCDSERYNLIILIDIGRTLYFNFGTRIINNFKAQKKTHCTFSISVSEAALLQYVCCFNLSNKSEFSQYVLRKFSSLIDEKIKSLN